MEQQKLTTFIDQTGRTIIGILASETPETIIVKDPAILYVQPTQDGKLNVQTIPLYFREFIGDKHKNDGTLWVYNRAGITLGLDIDNDQRLVTQYNNLFNAPIQSAQPTPATTPAVVKLFDN